MFGRLGELFEQAGMLAVEVGYNATHPEVWDSTPRKSTAPKISGNLSNGECTMLHVKVLWVKEEDFPEFLRSNKDEILEIVVNGKDMSIIDYFKHEAKCRNLNVDFTEITAAAENALGINNTTDNNIQDLEKLEKDLAEQLMNNEAFKIMQQISELKASGSTDSSKVTELLNKLKSTNNGSINIDLSSIIDAGLKFMETADGQSINTPTEDTSTTNKSKPSTSKTKPEKTTVNAKDAIANTPIGKKLMSHVDLDTSTNPA